MVPSSLRLRAALVALALGCALAPTAAAAQAVGTVTSGMATADGASAFNNPAAMYGGEGTLIELDVGAAFLNATYAPSPDTPVPGSNLGPTEASPLGPLLTLGGYTDALHDDWRIGLTATIPETQGGSWSRDGGASDITRYYMVDGALFHVSLVPAVSWSPIEWLAIGAGANITYGNVTMELDKDLGASLNQTAMSTEIDSPFPYAHPDLAAPVDGAADGWGLGAVFGVFLRPIEQLSFGLSVHTPVSIVSTGSLSVEYPERLRQFVEDTLPGAMLPELNGDFQVDMSRPWRFGAGVSAYPLPNLEVGFNYTFDNASSAPTFDIIVLQASSPSIEDTTKPQAYTNRHRFALRTAYLPIEQLRIVGFGSYQTNVVPDLLMAPNNIDFDRWEIGLAARWHIVPKFSVMVQYSHIFLVERVITDSLHMPLTQPSLAAFNHPSPTGTYSGSANTIRLGLGLHL